APLGRAPVTLARRAILAAAAMERHAQQLWSNGARPGGVIEVPSSIGEDGVKKIKSGWSKAHEGPNNAGKTAILWGGSTYKQTSLTSTDAQFLENRIHQLQEIARAFGAPAVMLGDLTKSSYANAEQKQKEFLSYCLEPWLR